MGSKIYMFDNNTGVEIPIKIGTTPVEILLGGTVSEVLNKIEKNSIMFCVFTKLKDIDIAVPSLEDKTVLEALSSFGKKDFKIEVRKQSQWYSNRVWKNIVISEDIGLDYSELQTFLNLYLTSCIDFRKRSEKNKRSEMYVVKNSRTGEEIFRTPEYNSAKNTCDKNPCNAIYDREGNLLYKSTFGRINIPNKDSINGY